MSYTAQIRRINPTAFLFVIDQSGSMNDRWQGTETTKAQAAADALNRRVSDLIVECSKSEGIRHYYDIGVIGYRGSGYGDALGFIPGPLLKPVGDLASKQLRIESRVQKIADGAGGLIEQTTDFPVWFEPVADGGTPMAEALSMAAHEIGAWCDAHPKAFPPTVIHITDGEPTTGDPEPVADVIRQLATEDGNVLLFNMHISSARGARVIFPAQESEISGLEAQRLFRMSSPLPDVMLRRAKEIGLQLASGAHGYGYQAGFEDLVNLLDIGTPSPGER